MVGLDCGATSPGPHYEAAGDFCDTRLHDHHHSASDPRYEDY